MGDAFKGEATDVLYVAPGGVSSERAAFIEKLKKVGRRGKKRALYSEYIGEIGANGVLDGIQTLWPKCHDEGHDLGKVIQERVKDVGLALRVCRDGCYSGCMHGVLMEAFAAARGGGADKAGHVNPEILATMMGDICERNTEMASSYSKGDCAHAVGHAMTVLADDEIPSAMEYCGTFTDTHMRYYCATGAYMQYIGEHDIEDAKTKSITYPCDSFAYPAACARYKLVHVLARNGGSIAITALFEHCTQLAGSYRLGCIHGLGNAAMPYIASGKVTLDQVCAGGTPDEKYVCVEGAIERLAKYSTPRAKKVCAATSSNLKAHCKRSIAQGMYNMEKDMTLYVR